MKKYLCEFLGTCVLVLFGCGVAVFTNADLVATALAFGLSIVAVAYVIGNVSGCHVNPAVTFAMWIDKRISGKDFWLYVIAQVLGAITGSALLILILNATTMGDYHTIGLGANGYGAVANNGLTLLGALITEVVLTFVFVLAVLGVTKDKKNSSVAPIVIGLTLTLVHILGIKLTGTSVNPARSTGPAVWLMGDSLSQLWVFWVGPFVGAAFAALVSFFIDLEPAKKEKVEVFDIEKVEALEMKETPKKEVVSETDTTKENESVELKAETTETAKVEKEKKPRKKTTPRKTTNRKTNNKPRANRTPKAKEDN